MRRSISARVQLYVPNHPHSARSDCAQDETISIKQTGGEAVAAADADDGGRGGGGEQKIAIFYAHDALPGRHCCRRPEYTVPAKYGRYRQAARGGEGEVSSASSH